MIERAFELDMENAGKVSTATCPVALNAVIEVRKDQFWSDVEVRNNCKAQCVWMIGIRRGYGCLRALERGYSLKNTGPQRNEPCTLQQEFHCWEPLAFAS